METLIVEKKDVPEERSEMYKLQIEVMEEIGKWVTSKIPNFIWTCSGDTIGLGMLVGSTEKPQLEVKYEVEFIRDDFLTPSREKCKEYLDKYVRHAFYDNAVWRINSFKLLEDEYFNVIEK